MPYIKEENVSHSAGRGAITPLELIDESFPSRALGFRFRTPKPYTLNPKSPLSSLLTNVLSE